MNFKPDFRPPKDDLPVPEEGEEITGRVEQIEEVEQVAIPRKLLKKVDKPSSYQLTEELQSAAAASGFKNASRLLRRNARQNEASRKQKAEDEAKFIPPGSVHYEEGELRKVFNGLDFTSSDRIKASELRHIFAQIGMMPTDGEIDGMIYMCDPEGEGVVTFENFLNVFSTPAESLRHINVHKLKELVTGQKDDESESSSIIEDEQEDDSSSSSS